MTDSLWLAILGYVLASNPFHRRPVLPLTDRPRQTALATIAAGAIVTMGVLSVIAAAGSAVLDALDISVANARVAAGLVVVLAAIVQFLRDPRSTADGDAAADGAPVGSAAALTPVFFPILLRPELAVLALVGGADVGWGAMAAAVLIGTSAVVAWAALAQPDSWTTRFERVFDRLVDVGLIVIGIDQIVDGVLAI